MITEQDISVSLTEDEIKIGNLYRNPNPRESDLGNENPIINMTISPSQREGRLAVIEAISEQLGDMDLRIFDKTHSQLIIRGTKNDLQRALTALYTSGMLEGKGVHDAVASKIDDWKPEKSSTPRLSAAERHDFGKGDSPQRDRIVR